LDCKILKEGQAAYCLAVWSWWLMLICCEKKVLLAGWWLVLI